MCLLLLNGFYVVSDFPFSSHGIVFVTNICHLLFTGANNTLIIEAA